MQLGVRNHFESNKSFTTVPIEKNKRPTSLAMAPKKGETNKTKQADRRKSGKKTKVAMGDPATPSEMGKRVLGWNDD